MKSKPVQHKNPSNIRSAIKHRKTVHCLDCPTVVPRGFPRCSVCYLKRRARKLLGSSERWEQLAAIFRAQKERCPYSGEHLVLQKNASLDHIKARSDGGHNRLLNYQWVYAPVNAMKGSMSEADFLTLVARIYHHTRKESIGCKTTKKRKKVQVRSVGMSGWW